MNLNILKKWIEWLKNRLNNPWIIGIAIIIMILLPALTCVPACIWAYGDRLGIIIGIFTALFAFLSWVQLRNLHINETTSPETVAGNKDIALLFELKGVDDLQPLIRWLEVNKKVILEHDVFNDSKIIRKNDKGEITSENTVDEEILRINDERESPFRMARDKSILIVKADKVDDWKNALGNMRCLLENISNIVSACGIGTIHLFYDGPVALAFPISDYFANRKKLVLHHWNKEGYIDIGSLGGMADNGKEMGYFDAVADDKK